MKVLRSPDYNYNFDNSSGLFMRWGKSYGDNPKFSPFGPEILDMEITSICSGPDGVPCSFCYKGNTSVGKNMSFEKFKKIFHLIPKNLTQIAFGVDASCSSNPDVWDIFNYCRDNSYNKVAPNVTVSNINEETALKLATVCGAVAVSRYENKNMCYDSVEKLSFFGLKQVNIHALICEETFLQTLETIEDIKLDKRLEKLNAIVFLSLKQKGRGTKFTPLSFDKFKTLINHAFEMKVNFGFDSCSAAKFLKATKDRKDFAKLQTYCEPCESGNFSAYINVEGKYFPCSFCEGLTMFPGIDVANCENFLSGVWFSESVNGHREMMSKRFAEKNFECPVFKV